jgi:hypothetical protein
MKPEDENARKKLCVLFKEGLEGIVEHGGVPALLKKVTRRVLVTCRLYYSSVSVNGKLKSCVNLLICLTTCAVLFMPVLEHEANHRQVGT